MFRDDLNCLVKCDTVKEVVSRQESMLNTHLFLEMHSDVWPRFSITTICDQLVVHFLENSPGGCSAGNPSSNLAERAERNGADKHGEEKNDLHGSGWNVGWFCRCHIYTASQVASSAIFHCLAILVHLNLMCFLFFGEERWRNIIHGCDGTCKGTFRKTPHSLWRCTITCVYYLTDAWLFFCHFRSM